MLEDVLLLSGFLQGREPRERVLRRRRVAALPLVPLARRERAGCRAHVVPPRHVEAVEQPRDVGPRVDRPLSVPPLVLRALELHVRDARHRIAGVEARRRPPGDQEQVRGKGPAVGRREHPILQHVRVRVPPVVGDLLARHVAHHVGLLLGSEERRAVRVRTLGAPVLRRRERVDEPVHRAAVDRGDGRALVVRTSLVALLGGSVDARPVAQDRVRDAVGRLAVLVAEPVHSWVRTEVVIERAILLHDEDQVIELEDALGLGGSLGARARERGRHDPLRVPRQRTPAPRSRARRRAGARRGRRASPFEPGSPSGGRRADGVSWGIESIPTPCVARNATSVDRAGDSTGSGTA